MKMKFGAIVVAGSGKVGGHVASRNRHGAYLRTKVTPVNPQTSSQLGIRSTLTFLSQSWRALTQDQRTAWNSAVGNFQKTDIFGDLKNPSGFNLYVKLNMNLILIGEGVIDVPPVPGDGYAMTEMALVIDDSSNTAILTYSPAIPADQRVQIYMTPGQSPGKNFVKSEYRLVTTMTDADASPFDLQAAYAAVFGTPVTGQKIFIRAVSVNSVTGQAGTPNSTFAIVVA